MTPHTHVDARAIDTAARLRAAGLRVTDSRRAVVEALRAHPHASADAIFGVVVETLPGTSLQSVYNALGDFVDAGLARRIEPAGRPGLFELRVDDNHHHLICSRCGAVEDVDCIVGAAPCLTPSDAHGYAVQVAEVTFWGVCPTCAEAEAVAVDAVGAPL
ncbi:Fur family transcriptional regulator [Microbacterium ureisolvens]|uniref:Fur family transcriptional regulator n=1 Tax=Microbacterium ureisolvens TaxID=2781186 RepID=UPI0036361D06